jgi:hypothetical protein
MAPSRNSRSPVLIALAVTLAAGITLGLAVFPHTSSVLAAKRSTAAKNNPPATPSAQHPNANPVLVELFTSEGCSDCPPADALLARLQHDQPIASANVIALEEHVDYWDRLGWKDRFSSPYITQRQQAYANQFHLDDVYTPQFVVNGSSQFDGTNPPAINAAIAKAAMHTLPLQINAVNVRNGTDITFKLADIPGPQGQRVSILAAVVEAQETSSVKKGENAGRILHHVDTVRAINALLPALSGSLSKQSFDLHLPDATRLSNPRLVVFLRGGPISASAVHTITNKEIGPLFPDTGAPVFSTAPGDPVTGPVR